MQATAKAETLKTILLTAFDPTMVRGLAALRDWAAESAREAGADADEAREQGYVAIEEALTSNPGLEELLDGFKGVDAERLEAIVRSLRPHQVARAYAVTSAPGVSRLDVRPADGGYVCTWTHVEGDPETIHTDEHPRLDAAALLTVMGL